MTSRNELDIGNTLGQGPRAVKRPIDVEADIEKFVLQRVEQLPISTISKPKLFRRF